MSMISMGGEGMYYSGTDWLDEIIKMLKGGK